MGFFIDILHAAIHKYPYHCTSLADDILDTAYGVSPPKMGLMSKFS